MASGERARRVGAAAAASSPRPISACICRRSSSSVRSRSEREGDSGVLGFAASSGAGTE
jgi:hypothetical protein